MEVARSAAAKSGNVTTHRNLHGKTNRNLSSIPNAANLVSIRVHVLHLLPINRTLDAYLDHLARRMHLLHPKICF